MTNEERTESQVFINEAMKSGPMRYVKNYLVAKVQNRFLSNALFLQNLAPSDELEFKKMLFNLWFQFYKREEKNDSSAFEHVFCGESDDGSVSGLHNWIQFFIEEAKGRVNYKGYLYPRRKGPAV